jgi:integrase
LLDVLAADRVIKRNPCRIKNGGKEESAERAALSVTEVFALADAVTPRYRVLVLFGAFTSLRFGELAALQQRDIDAEGRTVSVRKSQAELRNGRRLIKGPKSAAGVREVAIPKIVLDELKTHLAEYAESGDDGYVFVGPLGGRLRRHNFRKVWLEAVGNSKIKKTDVHFHDLRHTGNDLAAKAGATTKELMARMGHASVRAALIYQHASRERDHEIAEQMNRNVEKIRKPKKQNKQQKGHAGGHAG